MSTRFPEPQTMADLAGGLARVLADLRSLRVDLYGVAIPARKLVEGAMDFAHDERAGTCGEQSHASAMAAANAVKVVEAELRRLAALVGGAAQVAGEAAAKDAAAKANARQLRA